MKIDSWIPRLCAVTLLWSALSASAAPSVRVAVFGPDAPDAAARVAVEISKIEGIEVVERGQIEMLLGEQSLGTSGRERLALGRLLSADLLLLVGPKGDSFAYVDAHTGEELFRIREESLEALTRSAFLLVEELRDAEKAEAVSVAVLNDKETRETADALRVWLRGQGVRVLDRTLSHEVLEERTSIKQGLREKSDPLPAFPGADVFLNVLSVEGMFHLEALSGTGALLGVSPPWKGNDPPPEVQAFVESLLKPRTDMAPSAFRQRVNIEALQPFYRGVALYEAGKLLEATAEFQKAYEKNNKFTSAYLWEARCYQAAGLPELATAIHRWLDTGFAGRGVAAGADSSPRDGITFLGVTASDEKNSAKATRLSMAAIDALSGPELFLPESLGVIRDEYDLLAGASHTEGARWETSSGFVSRFTLRGAYEGNSCQWILAESLTGESLATLSDQPGDDPEAWAVHLRKLLPELVPAPGKVVPASSRSALTLPSKEQALAVWKKPGLAAEKNVALLQLILVDPADPQTDLKAFSESHSGRPAGLLARYFWLFDAQGRLPYAEVAAEAGAALAIQGRGDFFQRRIDPSWMVRFPHSFSLASFIAFRGIYDLPHPDGAPMPFLDDADAMRTHWRRMIDYTADTLAYHLSKVRTADEFKALDYPLQYFFHGLHGGAFWLSDDDYETTRQRLLPLSAAAAARAGVPDKASRAVEPDILDWRELTRAEVLRQSDDFLVDGPWYYHDTATIFRRLAAAAVTAFEQDPPSYRDWWEAMNKGLDESISYREMANRLVMPHLPKLLAIYGSGTLSDDERAMLLDTGIVLMWGWQFAEAERLFQLVVEAPPAVTSSERYRRGLQASALLHIARLQIQAKNKPAAIATLDRCVELSEGLDIRLCQRISTNFRDWIINPPGQRGNVGTIAIRMLDELRFDPAQAVFPACCGAVQVETLQLDNASVTFFYRLPPPSAVPPRVLVVVSNFNDGVARYCDDTNPLARFADAHNLALVVPQFFHPHTVWKKDHPCSPFHFPNLWSGQVLLEAVEKISQLRKLDEAKFLFHGSGSGAHFAARFARWKPERTGALSLHSGVEFPWFEREGSSPLGPVSAFHGLPVLLTTGENEDFGSGWAHARPASEVFSSILKSAGAEVDFRVIDGTSHTTPRRETLTEQFLARCLKPLSHE